MRTINELMVEACEDTLYETIAAYDKYAFDEITDKEFNSLLVAFHQKNGETFWEMDSRLEQECQQEVRLERAEERRLDNIYTKRAEQLLNNDGPDLMNCHYYRG